MNSIAEGVISSFHQFGTIENLGICFQLLDVLENIVW